MIWQKKLHNNHTSLAIFVIILKCVMHVFSLLLVMQNKMDFELSTVCHQYVR